MPFSQPLSALEQEYEVKRSRFITLLLPVNSQQQVRSALSEIRANYKGANHYCSAYLLGSASGVEAWGKSDDGEPSGTAGQPMLSILEHHQLVNVLAVVVRYFGGIKLGAGGLIRAYSGAVNQALAELPTEPLVELHRFRLSIDYPQQNQLEYQLQQAGIAIQQREFAAQVILHCASEQQLQPDLVQTLQRLGADLE